ncbi:hypothetical protein PHAMO_380046 [Magnetospirillum molischianum DSM 120]|uniref:Uncharacterized protein n=1 Tax=Magnetospirillum molischianum DSM 120 TaxID=1150626 RepID=H8FVJ0_MAGML|nr:hypothetical protein PHAMO_380046 [Magnetospirillum molischianum DSM 120]
MHHLGELGRRSASAAEPKGKPPDSHRSGPQEMVLGRVAQRESIRFTREGSQVQSLSRPPFPSDAVAMHPIVHHVWRTIL